MVDAKVAVDYIVIAVLVLLIIIACIAILNALTFPRLMIRKTPDVVPFVSVMIPARNESDIIAETIGDWMASEYSNFELIVLDDCSSDDTYKVLKQSLNGNDRLRIVSGMPLPPGWKGKNWACHQMSQIARGDIFLFTDADVRWEAQALTALVGEMIHSKGDLLTVWPTQITQTWAERLVVSLLGFVILGYLPALAVHHIRWPVFSAANGQCLAFWSHVYKIIGGHGAVRSAIIEDIVFAKIIKKERYHLRSADGAGLISTKMYHGWEEVRDGFAKNILAGHQNSVLFLLVSTIAHWMLFIFPWIWAIHKPMQGILMAVIGILARALTAAVTRQRIIDAVFLPISVLLLTVIALHSIRWFYTGGARWKGRTYGT